MKPIIRYVGTIAVTAVVSLAIATSLIGSSSADADPAPPQTVPQPAQAPTTGAVPAPPVQQADKGAATGSGANPATGSATPDPGNGPAPATGSGSADQAAVQAGAAGPGSAAGAGSAAPAANAGSAAEPAKPAKPAFKEVACGTLPVPKNGASTINGATDAEIEVGSTIKFVMPAGSDAQPDNANASGFAVSGGETKCFQVARAGQFLFHVGSRHAQLTARAWYDFLVNKRVDDLVGGNFWMPLKGNLPAEESDVMYYSVLGLSAFFFFAITGAVVYFVIKYRHRPGHKAQPSAAHNDALEVTWTVIPTIICVFLFYYGWNTYIRVVTPPQKAVEINVLAWRWNWQFTHSNGVTDSDLHVPVGTPVRLVMTSKDVLHSFYAPVMRVKQDIIPRRYTYAWFLPTKPGTYRLNCAEYCGTNHSQMGITNDGRRAVVVVHEPGGYERYLSDKAAESNALPPEQLGKVLYEKKGCNACHTVDGSARVGPSWKGTYGKPVPLADGSSVQMDDNYIRESIEYPQAKSRPGYPPSMPSFQGQLKDVEIEGLIAYIKSLK